MTLGLVRAFIVLILVIKCIGFVPNIVSSEANVVLEVVNYLVTNESVPIKLKCNTFSMKKLSGVNDIMWQHKKCGSGLSLVACDELPVDEPWQFTFCRNQTKPCTSSTLTIFNPREQDGGLYRCIHKNYIMRQYTVNRMIQLEITDPRMSSIQILPETFDMDNQTIVENQTAVFRCRVRSIVKPHIVWVRQLQEDNEIRDVLFDGMPLRFMNGTEIHDGADKHFTSKLQIQNASLSDGGVFICYAFNEMKSVSKQVSLTVKPIAMPLLAPSDLDSGSISSEIFWIGLASILSGTCCALIMCLLVRRRRTCAASDSAKCYIDPGLAECSEHPLCQ